MTRTSATPVDQTPAIPLAPGPTPLELLNETVLTVAQAACLVPSARSKGKIHAGTVTRWILHGKRWAGHHIKLEGVQTPGGLRTSKEALNRFFERLAIIRDPKYDRVNQIMTPAQKRRFEAAEKKNNAEIQKRLKEKIANLGKPSPPVAK